MFKKCSRCHSETLEGFFKRNRKGILNKCCNNCLNRRFKCTHCDFKCSQKGGLRTHIKTIHDKIKDHECPKCDYKCSQKINLQKHIKQVHDKIKDHECPKCDFKCSTTSILRTHIKAVHDKIKDHECPNCDYKCSRNGNLQKHVKTCTGTLHCSSGELAVMKTLEKLGFKKDVDYFYDESYALKDKSYLKWDFRINADEPLFIEYDGRCHYFPIRYGGISEERAEENLQSSKHRDKLKNDYCNDNGYALLRIPYWQKKDIETLVSEFIHEFILVVWAS